MTGTIEATETRFYDKPEAQGYPAPQQQGQYPPYQQPGQQQGPYPPQQQGHYPYPPQQQQWPPQGSYQPQGQPGPVGFASAPGSTMPTFYAPADMDDHPIYVGTALRGPFQLNCGPCGYQGNAKIVTKIGCGWAMFLMMTFGLSLLCPHWGRDTYIVCPNCNKAVGVAKIM